MAWQVKIQGLDAGIEQDESVVVRESSWRVYYWSSSVSDKLLDSSVYSCCWGVVRQ